MSRVPLKYHSYNGMDEDHLGKIMGEGTKEGKEEREEKNMQKHEYFRTACS